MPEPFIGSQEPKHSEPIDLGEHQVEHDDIRKVLLEGIDGSPSIMGDEDVETGFLEDLATDIGHEAVVFSNENAGHG